MHLHLFYRFILIGLALPGLSIASANAANVDFSATVVDWYWGKSV